MAKQDDEDQAELQEQLAGAAQELRERFGWTKADLRYELMEALRNTRQRSKAEVPA